MSHINDPSRCGLVPRYLEWLHVGVDGGGAVWRRQQRPTEPVRRAAGPSRGAPLADGDVVLGAGVSPDGRRPRGGHGEGGGGAGGVANAAVSLLRPDAVGVLVAGQMLPPRVVVAVDGAGGS